MIWESINARICVGFSVGHASSINPRIKMICEKRERESKAREENGAIPPWDKLNNPCNSNMHNAKISSFQPKLKLLAFALMILLRWKTHPLMANVNKKKKVLKKYFCEWIPAAVHSVPLRAIANSCAVQLYSLRHDLYWSCNPEITVEKSGIEFCNWHLKLLAYRLITHTEGCVKLLSKSCIRVLKYIIPMIYTVMWYCKWNQCWRIFLRKWRR